MVEADVIVEGLSIPSATEEKVAVHLRLTNSETGERISAGMERKEVGSFTHNGIEYTVYV